MRPARRARAARRARHVHALAAAALAAAVLIVATGGGTETGAPVGGVDGVVGAPEASSALSVRPAPAAAVRPLGVPDPRLEKITPTPAPPEALTGYVWPLPRGRLTLAFGPSRWGSRIVDGERFHDGIDLATFCGDPIMAAHDGVVLAAGRRFDGHMGWRGDLAPYTERLESKAMWGTLPIVVVVDDGNGYRSLYAHFNRVVVKPGQRVEAGRLLGYEGATGRATGCHLHYGLFSPLEPRTFAIDPEVVGRMLVPTHQTARIDPLLVLPPRPAPGDTQPRPRSGPF